ncbi:MAG: hypothetical protein PHU97_02245 [Bacteroidales bacterium]|nr:hypothetical protein [Bacteroidales bacterium]
MYSQSREFNAYDPDFVPSLSLQIRCCPLSCRPVIYHADLSGEIPDRSFYHADLSGEIPDRSFYHADLSSIMQTCQEKYLTGLSIMQTCQEKYLTGLSIGNDTAGRWVCFFLDFVVLRPLWRF